MNPEEWDFIQKMLNAYEEGKPWNFGDPTSQVILRRFYVFVQAEKGSV